ncbi:MAG: hypothetical protein CL930_07710 [Deltaproteobacteria bacterium]|nr:hypothetical protein [Deltaproteobacteria bacterium]
MGKKTSQTLVALFMSIALIWALATTKDMNWPSLLTQLNNAHLGWVGLAATLLLVEFYIRALRWSILLRPLGTEGKILDLWSATVIGAAVNTIGFRAGEIAKPFVAVRRTGYSMSGVIATNVMERVFDLLGLVSILLLMVLTISEVPGDEQLIFNLYKYGGYLGCIALLAMTTFFVLATREQAARSLFVRILSIVPSPARPPFLSLFDGFVAGLGSSRDKRSLWTSAALSIGIWVNGAMAIWVLFLAFGFELSFAAACCTGVAVALASVLPQVGNVTVIAATVVTMTLWGIAPDPAGAFALVFWAVSFVPVTGVGLIAMWREGLSVSKISTQSQNESPKGG